MSCSLQTDTPSGVYSRIGQLGFFTYRFVLRDDITCDCGYGTFFFFAELSKQFSSEHLPYRAFLWEIHQNEKHDIHLKILLACVQIGDREYCLLFVSDNTFVK